MRGGGGSKRGNGGRSTRGNLGGGWGACPQGQALINYRLP